MNHPLHARDLQVQHVAVTGPRDRFCPDGPDEKALMTFVSGCLANKLTVSNGGGPGYDLRVLDALHTFKVPYYLVLPRTGFWLDHLDEIHLTKARLMALYHGSIGAFYAVNLRHAARGTAGANFTRNRMLLEGQRNHPPLISLPRAEALFRFRPHADLDIRKAKGGSAYTEAHARSLGIPVYDAMADMTLVRSNFARGVGLPSILPSESCGTCHENVEVENTP